MDGESASSSTREEPAATPSRKGEFDRRWLYVGAPITFLFVAGWLALWPAGIVLDGSPVRLSTAFGSINPPLLADENNVYYQESKGGRFRIVSASVSGGAANTLALPLTNPDPGVISRDGVAFLLRGIEGDGNSDQPLYRQPVNGDPAIRLGETLAYDSSWTPDGQGIVFSRQRSIFLANAKGGDVRRLADVPGRAYWFRWSPDGATLRFSVYDSGLSTYSIWETPSLNSKPSRVSFGLGDAPQCCGNWSADGRVYFFQSMVGGFWHVFGFQQQVFLFGRRARQLTSGTFHFRSPLPLPDGSRLAMLTTAQRAEVSRYDSGADRWVPLFEGVSAATVAFSPDGKSAVFTRLPDRSLWRCWLPNCSQPVPLVPGKSNITMPRWSPDGTSIAFMIRQPDGRWRIAIVPANGSGPARLVGNPGAEADPTWSPDSRELAFGSAPSPDSGFHQEVYSLNLASGRAAPVSGSRGLRSPAWAPDGRHLAAIRSMTGELAIYDFASGVWTNPAPGIRVGYLNWSASGGSLYFLAMPPGVPQKIMRLELGSGDAFQVGGFEGLNRPSFAFGDWLGLGPDGSPLSLRDLSMEEVIAWSYR